MKGVKKWTYTACLSSLALVLSVVISSLLGTVNVSALKYAFNAYPLYSSRVYNSDNSAYYQSSNPAFSVWFDSSGVSGDIVSESVSNGSYLQRQANNGLCTDIESPSYPIFGRSYVNSSYYYHVWSGEGTGFLRYFNNLDCSQYDIRHYSYDSIYSTKYNLSTGEPEQFVSLNHSLFNSYSPFYSSGSIKRLDVPLNLSHENVGVIPANTPVSWEFGLVGQQPFSYIDPTPHISLSLTYFDSQGSVVSDSAVCSFDDNFGVGIEVGHLQILPYWGFKVTCSYTPSTSMDYVNAHLRIYSGFNDYNPSIFLTYSNVSDVYFYGGYLITNNDDTWSGLMANNAPTGTDIDEAPGYSELYPPNEQGCSEGDWFCNLINLFNFNFLNPFAPVFALFTDNNSCVAIPTIAGMLNSDERYYCPWFDSHTRDVLTPVVGLSATMLLFGFIVRWLSSSSGEMIIDSPQVSASPSPSRGISSSQVHTRGTPSTRGISSSKVHKRGSS